MTVHEATRDVVTVAASAGGVTALQKFLSSLPADLPATVLIATHLPASGNSTLAGVLQRSTSLRVAFARPGDLLELGHVLVAPANHHMIVTDGGVQLSQGPRQNGVRPSADPLFCSAALAAGPRALGIVLSGTLDDGAVGAAAIERHGGLVAVQDPAEASYDGMPNAALDATENAFCGSLEKIAEMVVREARTPVGPVPLRRDRELERRVADLLSPASAPEERPPGSFAGLSCPDCGGPIYTAAATGGSHLNRYECLIGHAWSPRSLLENQATAVERALNMAARQLEERMLLTARLSEGAADRGHKVSAAQFRRVSEDTRNALETIRGLLAEISPLQNTPQDVSADIPGDEVP
ncbi:chemotaxis protein CheB [Actinoallomurus sp. NBC_01490]|jgi:two-component system chemotaxis response regulator CheB|uniref:chemotaxis protein CheB n=1 Tax=Actinoallomurus sp. NBC_01490 TaxID=2903557 RepID=UPI002E3488E8|nr:chemotaxis protein CheB [Actinoallomurus sp. NBC_01490]